jgi:leader peptidase (prepilin peptidase)/N-methyltransferase
MLTAWVVAVGLVIGSFLNVVIHRLPKEQSVVTPRSRCPVCLTPIRARDNVPILSYLLLRGRCRACGTRIAWRYPAVEALTAALFALVLREFGPTLEAAVLAAFLCGLIVVSFIDLDLQIIPNAVIVPGIPLGLLAGALLGDPPLVDRLVGVLAGAGFLYLVLYYGGLFYGQEAMGEGDLNLIAFIGAFLGWRGVIVTILVGCFTGSAVGLALIGLRRLTRRQTIPFGPFLSVGAVVALFWGERLIARYLRLF